MGKVFTLQDSSTYSYIAMNKRFHWGDGHITKYCYFESSALDSSPRSALPTLDQNAQINVRGEHHSRINLLPSSYDRKDYGFA